jgi:hypothetical protein
MLASAEHPDRWKRAQINPIPKISCPTKNKDYRPISLLCHLGKFCEEVIINKLRTQLDKVIDPSQFAYQPNIGTVDALIQVMEDFTAQLDKPHTKFIQSAALDFSKAFDRLQPAILVEKIQKYEFNHEGITLVSSFLHNRMQCVKYGNSRSTYISAKIGAPQGTKLGPILWLIYSNDLKAEGYNHVKYADDTTFYVAVNNHTDQSAIAPTIQSTQSWSANNNMLLNADKTEIMNSSLSHHYTYDNQLHIDDYFLTPSPCTKFLGILIDNKLSFNNHVDNLVTKCNSRLFLMRKLRTIGLSNEGPKLLYTTNI